MEVVSGSGKWKYCEVVVDGPNEPPYNDIESDTDCFHPYDWNIA